MIGGDLDKAILALVRQEIENRIRPLVMAEATALVNRVGQALTVHADRSPLDHPLGGINVTVRLDMNVLGKPDA